MHAAHVLDTPSSPQHARVASWARRHGTQLHELARRWCRAPLDPDDLVQDVLERALRTSAPEGANAIAWLSRMMRNLFIDRVRQHAARRAVFEAAAEALSPQAPSDPVWWEELAEADVRAEVACLPAPQRTTFERFTFAGQSYDEIAVALGVARNTVGTRVLRARLALRARLTERVAASA